MTGDRQSTQGLSLMNDGAVSGRTFQRIRVIHGAPQQFSANVRIQCCATVLRKRQKTQHDSFVRFTHDERTLFEGEPDWQLEIQQHTGSNAKVRMRVELDATRRDVFALSYTLRRVRVEKHRHGEEHAKIDAALS